MVGLSVVLEGNENITGTKTNVAITATATCATSSFSNIVNKASTVTIKPFSPNITISSPFCTQNSFAAIAIATTNCGFLDSCFLCKQKLLPGQDIYMYKGDRAFCSVECRCSHIFKDEEETTKTKPKDNCSLASIKPQASSSTSTC
uniref:Uncharacterized protein LOC104220051 n=1 Tax=Nicotiana sylvestris TaxID=4096 RepID=A0A1U7VW09_NICSY|nr:PREDICTED: uncharacterized protein LOC104220051 [Nicotiana sylvestris]